MLKTRQLFAQHVYQEALLQSLEAISAHFVLQVVFLIRTELLTVLLVREVVLSQRRALQLVLDVPDAHFRFMRQSQRALNVLRFEELLV